MTTMKSVESYDPALAIPLIKEYEGCKLDAYLCPAGVWTIGYGHTAGVKRGQSISNAQADQYLEQDLENVKKELIKLCKVPITEGMFIALMSFVYNFGYTKCKDYPLFKLLNEKKYQEAADRLLLYNKSGGKTLTGLTRRRTAERNYFVRDGV